MENKIQKQKNVALVSVYNEEKVEISDILEIVSSTDKEITAKSENKFVTITGSELSITKLIPDGGMLSVSGKISGVSFSGKQTKKSFIGKVFK